MSDLFKRLLLLKRSQIFSMVATDDLRRVAGSMEEVQFFRGDRIFAINDQGDHLYLLVSGKVGITIDPKPGSKNFIASFGPGPARRSAAFGNRPCARGCGGPDP